ncbi:membrane-bound lytic murein transglycosylase MltC [Candidatus Erwinia haradaeae]|uniref:peptidoglycan lytic exotransglycosylase n=1 Tax=Candidatus Erwinia haradaeae TaxID=1922217 RepID=A0A451DKD8_9GAMM|nr:membrane-bound lytic murein transglycosylase MltC [Candidatus Erwinia haradaeae]VFP87184.1 Membrane-bound lytic murein transglycosylase C [Candidatus Erwinia haradaeae]
MYFKKNFFYIGVFSLSILLISCSQKTDQDLYRGLIKDTNGFDILMEQFSNNIEILWGRSEVVIPGPKDYIKYSDQNHTRSYINFEAGRITLSTIVHRNPISCLRRAIVNLLLMSKDSCDVNLSFIGKTSKEHQEPLLYGQVLDNTGKPINNQKIATMYADYLIQTKREHRYSNLHVIWSVTIPMVSNHIDQRAHKYLPMVQKMAQRYGVSKSLILAIINIESSFNPYAVSHSNALGLMQIVQNTAGLDVFRMHGKTGQPSRRYLLDPENNIDTGAAYLSLLQKNYLSAIKNPISRLYAVITAYHSGSGSVLRVFSSNKNRAIYIINALPPSEVYHILINKHPTAESRRYLYKVYHAQKSYNLY